MDRVYFGLFTKSATSEDRNKFSIHLTPWNEIDSSANHQTVVLLGPSDSSPPVTDARKSWVEFFTSMQDQVASVVANYQHIQHFTAPVPEELLGDVEIWSRNLATIIPADKHLALSIPTTARAFRFWSQLQESLRFPANISIFLYITTDNDYGDNDERFPLKDWKYESVSGIIIPASNFDTPGYMGDWSNGVTSANAYHRVLPAADVANLHEFCNQNRPLIILAHTEPNNANMYRRYLKHLLKSFELPRVVNNVIRDPLQPHRDNLTQDIYEIFEKDRAKYEMYARAIQSAIEDIHKPKISVLVIGPGRGPLIDIVDRCLSENPAEVVAVEKNIQCMAILNSKLKSWKHHVQLIHSDVRDYYSIHSSPPTFDLIVSELLGSFACNELSPDILKSIPASPDVIMIPSSYENFVQPIHSPAISQMIGTLGQWERPYVVDVGDDSYKEIDDPKAVWRYSHPSDNITSWNVSLTFENKTPYRVHGVLGYFTSVLYGPHKIGIHPDQRSIEGEYCNSWSPIYFPLRSPSKYDGEIKIRRQVRPDGVSYEWDVNGDVHNANGEKYIVELAIRDANQ